MKPTPPLTPNQTSLLAGEGAPPAAPMFPPTDFQFQAPPAKAVSAPADSEKSVLEARSLWRATANLVGGADAREEIGETSIFIGVVCVAAAALFATAFTMMRIAQGW